jgi:predicted secreted protein
MKTFSDPGQPIEVDVGEEFLIDLGPTPLSGHEWTFISSKDPVVCSLEKFASSDLESDSASSSTPTVGRSANYVFRCAVGSQFSGLIQFKKKRPWESEHIGVRGFRVVAK